MDVLSGQTDLSDVLVLVLNDGSLPLQLQLLAVAAASRLVIAFIKNDPSSIAAERLLTEVAELQARQPMHIHSLVENDALIPTDSLMVWTHKLLRNIANCHCVGGFKDRA
jgi:hypothetical protein